MNPASSKAAPAAREALRERLRELAATYERREFVQGDPSWFMHQVDGVENQETAAFVVSALSYGRREQFMQKAEWIMEKAGWDVYGWTRDRAFLEWFAPSDSRSFYRLHTFAHVSRLLSRLADAIDAYGSLGAMLRSKGVGTALEAVDAITSWFAAGDASAGGGLVPKDSRSACKRVCMFLRWMARDGSPVDLGLWSDFIPRSTLIMPMDTHVVQEARRLGLLSSSSASMPAALRLTDAMRAIFPDDPLKGDFALFGLGISGG